MSIMVTTGRGATQGASFRDAAAIDNLRRVDTLIVSKMGTLTSASWLSDPVKGGTPEALAVLHVAGLRIVMATGDHALDRRRAAGHSVEVSLCRTQTALLF
ncbi:MAG TPA: hypothetical protein VF503_00190 [Sphingobium sp.]|uniref:hypothetical protein n=1 Tax=Sphingobium sp. TaxID=1912891 RepID=UPI002ED46621